MQLRILRYTWRHENHIKSTQACESHIKTRFIHNTETVSNIQDIESVWVGNNPFVGLCYQQGTKYKNSHNCVKKSS